MKMTGWLSGAAIAVLGLTGSATTGFAAAGDECVKILGYEWSGEKQSMDPADMHSGDDAYHTFAVYNRLVDIDDNFNVLPELATEWSVSEDGLTWTFKLREGVKFHSGKDFSSADVVWSFKRLLDEKTGSGARAVLEFLDRGRHQRAGCHDRRLQDQEPGGRAAGAHHQQVHQHRAGRRDRRDAEAEGRRHRPVHAGAVHAERAGAHPAQEPELLERRPAEIGMPAHHRGAGSGRGRLGDQGGPGRPDAQRRSVGHLDAQGRSVGEAAGDRRRRTR